MDFLSERHQGPRLGTRVHRRGDGQLLVHRRRLCVACHASAARDASSIRSSLVNWQRAVKQPGGTRLHAPRRADRGGDASAHSSTRSSRGCASATWSRRSTTPAIRGVDGFGGDYAAIVPLLPSGAEASAPHLTWDDRPMRAGEGTFFEIAGCLQAVSLPAVAHGVPRQADAAVPRRGEGNAGGHGSGARRREARQCLRGHRQRVLRRAAQVRHREGQPHRLFDRPQLPAGLGRAHHEPAARRQDRARSPA